MRDGRTCLFEGIDINEALGRAAHLNRLRVRRLLNLGFISTNSAQVVYSAVRRSLPLRNGYLQAYRLPLASPHERHTCVLIKKRFFLNTEENEAELHGCPMCLRAGPAGEWW